MNEKKNISELLKKSKTFIESYNLKQKPEEKINKIKEKLNNKLYILISKFLKSTDNKNLKKKNKFGKY